MYSPRWVSLILGGALLGCASDRINTPVPVRPMPGTQADVVATYEHIVRSLEHKIVVIKSSTQTGPLAAEIGAQRLAKANRDLAEARTWLQTAKKRVGDSPKYSLEDGTWEDPNLPTPALIDGKTVIDLRSATLSSATTVKIIPALLSLTVSGNVQKGSLPSYEIDISYAPYQVPTFDIAHTWDIPGSKCKEAPVQAAVTSNHKASWVLSENIGGGIHPLNILRYDDDTCPQIPNSITVTFASSTIAVGASTQATAVAKDANGATINCQFTWQSTNEDVATVSSSGIVTAVTAWSFAPIQASCNEAWGYSFIRTQGTGSTLDGGADDPGGNGGSGGEPPPGGGGGGGETGGGTLEVCWIELEPNGTTMVNNPDGPGMVITGLWKEVEHCAYFTQNVSLNNSLDPTINPSNSQFDGQHKLLLVATYGLPGHTGVAVVRGAAADNNDYILVHASQVNPADLMFALQKAKTLGTIAQRDHPRAFIAERGTAVIRSSDEAQRMRDAISSLRSSAKRQTPFGERAAVEIDLTTPIEGR